MSPWPLRLPPGHLGPKGNWPTIAYFATGGQAEGRREQPPLMSYMLSHLLATLRLSSDRMSAPEGVLLVLVLAEDP
jgi:hypothetical protein